MALGFVEKGFVERGFVWKKGSLEKLLEKGFVSKPLQKRLQHNTEEEIWLERRLLSDEGEFIFYITNYFNGIKYNI